MLRNDRKAETLFNHHFPTSLSPSFEMLKTSEKNMNYSNLLGAKENTVELCDGVSLGVWKRPSVKLNACLSVLSA